MMTSKQFSVFLLAVIVVLLGLLGFVWQEKRRVQEQNKMMPYVDQNKNDGEQQPPLSEGYQGPSAEMSTFTSRTYGYSIQYPGNWFVDNQYSESAFTQRGPKEDNTSIGGDTYFSNYKNHTDFEPDNPAPKDLQVVSLMVYKVDAKTTYDSFIKQQGFLAGKKEDVTVGGIKGVKYTSVSDDHPVGVTQVTYLLKKDTKMYFLAYGGNPLSDQLKETADKIINSFTLK